MRGFNALHIIQCRDLLRVCLWCNVDLRLTCSLDRCFKCPTSYHLNCIPPDARYHELALLCGDHPEVKPKFRDSSSGLVLL